MTGRNCPNCGSPFSLDEVKCPFCGSLYFDMSAIDLTEETPIYIRYKIPYDKKSQTLSFKGEDSAYFTQCAIPRLGSVTVENETTDLTDRYGNIVKTINSGGTCTTNLVFESIPFPSRNRQALFTLEVPE